MMSSVKKMNLALQLVVLVFLILSFFSVSQAAVESEENMKIPVPGMVTMVDIGAKKCVPCKMMAPIIEELQEEYKDRASVIFIDVWVNPAEGKRFSISSIPTQIFFDEKGVEVERHVGFLDKKSIVAIFNKLGVE